jgi:putative ABC transport system permease protein
MKGPLVLALRRLVYHWGQSAALVASLSLIAYLPLAVGWLTGRFHDELLARSRATPLLVGAAGSRYDLALHALYFEGAPPAPAPMREVRRIADSGLAQAIPLLVRGRAGGRPVVGTTLDYFEFRGLAVERGRMLSRLGDCILGAAAARRLGLGPGGRLVTAPQNVFDVAGEYPLKLRVVGVLAQSHSPDDDAVFVDLKTAWIMEGIGHGHEDVARADEERLLKSDGAAVVAGAALPKYTEITDENIDSFHFHGDPDEFPATAIVAAPKDERSKAVLRGRYLEAGEPLQCLDPEETVLELLAVVVKIKRFFDAQAVLGGAAALALVSLIVLLGVRLRRREMETMFRIGCSRSAIFWLYAWEWGMLAAASAAIVAAAAQATVAFASPMLRALLF